MENDFLFDPIQGEVEGTNYPSENHQFDYAGHDSPDAVIKRQPTGKTQPLLDCIAKGLSPDTPLMGTSWLFKPETRQLVIYMSMVMTKQLNEFVTECRAIHGKLDSIVVRVPTGMAAHPTSIQTLRQLGFTRSAGAESHGYLDFKFLCKPKVKSESAVKSEEKPLSFWAAEVTRKAAAIEYTKSVGQFPNQRALDDLKRTEQMAKAAAEQSPEAVAIDKEIAALDEEIERRKKGMS